MNPNLPLQAQIAHKLALALVQTVQFVEPMQHELERLGQRLLDDGRPIEELVE